MILDEIFEQLKEAAAQGATLPTPQFQEVEEDLKPFIVRPMTADEVALITARDVAEIEAQKLVARVAIMQQLGLISYTTPQDIERDEKIKFRALLLGDLFFWAIQAATGWQFASIFYRRHEGRMVLVGLKMQDSLAYHKKQQEEQDFAELIDEYQGPSRLVN